MKSHDLPTAPKSVRAATVLAALALALLPAMAGAAEGDAKKIDERINEAMKPATDFINSVVFFAIKINDEISMPLVLIWLAAAAIFCTIYFKFVNLRSWGLAIRTIRGKYSSPDDPGEITHFQALTAALSGTVGLGNIAGVATAISIGGPGATFWMIVMGFLGMTAKFAECTLGVKYREIDAKGKVFGGPMQYLKKGLAERGLKEFGMIMAVFFAFMCIGGSFGGGNMYQINSATSQFVNTFCEKGGFWDSNRWLFGLIVAVVVGAVIIGGIRSIGKVTARLVPLMCGMYVLGALVVLLTHISRIPGAFGEIFYGAFHDGAVVGGLVGVLIQGMRRATFSNEAGVGSAAIAHSAVRTSKPASEGIVALLEPFVDTVVICTMTALAIIVTGTYKETGVEGIQITSDAFATVVPWFPYVLSLAVILFAFSTMISWSYYGQQAWAYLFGRSKGVELSYNLLFCSAIVVGAALTLGQVTDFSDAMIFAMGVPNLIGVYILLPVIKRELKDFREHADKIDRGE